MDEVAIHRFSSKGLDRVRKFLWDGDPICRAVASRAPIESGSTQGFYAAAAAEWLKEEYLDGCLPRPLEGLGRTEVERFIAEYVNGGEPDRIALFFSVCCEDDPGFSTLGTPVVFVRRNEAPDRKAVWHFLQGPDVTAEAAWEALTDAAEWPAICILTRTGLGGPMEHGRELDTSLVGALAEHTGFILVGVFDCGERLIWSRSEASFQAAAVWFEQSG
jgi:hypothetical protein